MYSCVKSNTQCRDRKKAIFPRIKIANQYFFLLRILYIHIWKKLLAYCYASTMQLKNIYIFLLPFGRTFMEWFYGILPNKYSLLCHCHHGSVQDIVGLAIHVIEGFATALVAEKRESHFIICRLEWALQLHIHWAAFLRVLYTISQRWIQRWLGSILTLPFSQARYL